MAGQETDFEGHAAGGDTGFDCLIIIARLRGIAVDPAHIPHEFAEPARPFDADLIRLAAYELGLRES